MNVRVKPCKRLVIVLPIKNFVCTSCRWEIEIFFNILYVMFNLAHERLVCSALSRSKLCVARGGGASRLPHS
jgi:hypothetical protein